jgi:hypothetical protein
MLANRFVGTGVIALALAVSIVGWRLSRRYGAAIEYAGIGRPYPLRRSAAAREAIAATSDPSLGVSSV